jgi:hypothetical protein
MLRLYSTCLFAPKSPSLPFVCAGTADSHWEVCLTLLLRRMIQPAFMFACSASTVVVPGIAIIRNFMPLCTATLSL